MQQLADTFTVDFAAAAALVDQLVSDLPEFQHLRQARIGCVLQQPALFLRGQPCRAYITEPRVQGTNSRLFTWQVAEAFRARFAGEEPDFLIYVDAVSWDELARVDRGQEWLVYHELSHVYQKVDGDGNPKFSPEDGRPTLALRFHDYEFFDAEVRRYGPEVAGLVDAALALAQCARDAQARRRPRRIA